MSRALSMLLRHDPGRFGVTLDAQGWADVSSVVAGLRSAGFPADAGAVARIVAGDEKRRYALTTDGARIRANQGHSVPVELGLVPPPPPSVLYHGTVARVVEAIRCEGISRRERRHVHLSATRETAGDVGRRRGRPVVLVVDAAAMARDGHAFYLSDNGVWLTEHVPPKYVVAPRGGGDAAGCEL